MGKQNIKTEQVSSYEDEKELNILSTVKSGQSGFDHREELAILICELFGNDIQYRSPLWDISIRSIKEKDIDELQELRRFPKYLTTVIYYKGFQWSRFNVTPEILEIFAKHDTFSKSLEFKNAWASK